jgi:rubrerythrin
MNNRFDEIADILRKAFQVEVDGHTFYTLAAEKADKPAVKKLFERLARDEVEHQDYLRAVMRRYEDHGAKSFRFDPRDPDLGEFSSQIFTNDFTEQAKGESFPHGAVSIGIQLETNATDFFSLAAERAKDPQIAGFYRFLADWEGSHLRLLQKLYDSIRTESWPHVD